MNAAIEKRVADLETVVRRLERERDEARQAFLIGVHSCSTYCKRPLCVARRERDEYKAQRDRLAEALRDAMVWTPQPYQQAAREALAAVEGGKHNANMEAPNL